MARMERLAAEHLLLCPRLAPMDAIAESVDYPAVFRERAEELRSIAALVHDERNRDILLKCAADYDAMAVQHEQASAQGGVFKYPQQESSRQQPH